ncbi:transporter [Burkholderia dolosa]|uniref:SphA family protein n=1 Tax=Burkholderia dolosa TaxID=152500 RepID=UPI001B8F841D|nr:transporter [Burkholderia dolosa]MBR8458032.1 transporter [Burkholderia dolosa]MDN7422951.1 transporter [Burkholderia dolosa]
MEITTQRRASARRRAAAKATAAKATKAVATAGALATTLLYAGTGTAHAAENGAPITPYGVFDFGAGILPPPTPNGTFATRFAYYSAHTLKDAAGNRVPNDFAVDVASWSVAYIRMTNAKLFGANVGFGAVVPFLGMSAHTTVPTPGGAIPLSANPVGIGDIDVQPLILAWSSRNLFVNVALQVQAPTGAYRSTRLINPGSNHWTLSPIVGATYITPGGFELSTSIEIDQHTTNRATDYRSGTEFRQEFAAAQHIGPFTVGIGGYVYRQLSDDHGPNVDGNRSSVNALGPAISYVEPGKPAFWLHVYKEFGAKNRSEGYQIALRAAISF